MKIYFTKLEALENDFILIDNTINKNSFSKENIIFMCNRTKGIGCDQLFILNSLSNTQVDVSIYNSDGTSTNFCGNGFRALAKYFLNIYGINTINITCNGISYKAIKFSNTEFGVVVDNFILNSSEIPVLTNEPQNINISHKYQKGVALNIGNTHVVFFINTNPSFADIEELNALVSKSKLFPNGVNVELCYIENTNIYMKVWERGAGYTKACGSGATASFFAAKYLKYINANEANIIMDGGTLKLKQLDSNSLVAISNANIVFTGEIVII